MATTGQIESSTSISDSRRTGFSSEWIIFGLILLAGIILRFFIFLTTERYADMGEALVGFMARDILYGKNFPILMYHHSFEGGGALMAYFLVPFIWIFGVSSFALKLSTFFIFSLTLL